MKQHTASIRTPRATVTANPEFKHYVVDLISRAYLNLHGVSFDHTDRQWQSAITATAMQLCLDARAREFSARELIQILENLIHVSETHLSEAKRHAAMASNVFYLKETALDALLIPIQPPSPLVSTIVLHKVYNSFMPAPAANENAA